MKEYVINAPRRGTVIKAILITFFSLGLLIFYISQGIKFSGEITFNHFLFILAVSGLLLPSIIIFCEPTLAFTEDIIKVQSWGNQLLGTNHYHPYPMQDIKVWRNKNDADTVWQSTIVLRDYDKVKKLIYFTKDKIAMDLIAFHLLSKKDLLAKLNDGNLNIKIEASDESGFLEK